MLNWPFKKESIKGTKIRLAKKKPHSIVLLLKSYSEGFNSKRISYEIILPVIFSLLTMLLLYFSDIGVNNLLLKIKDTNSQIADIIAIQIGFNITCLALIASFNRESLHNTFSTVKESEKEAVLHQLLSTFTYCVFIQVGVIFSGIIYNIVIDEIHNLNFWIALNNHLKLWIAFIFFFIWICIILHSFMVFLRNINLIHKFILIAFKRS